LGWVVMAAPPLVVVHLRRDDGDQMPDASLPHESQQCSSTCIGVDLSSTAPLAAASEYFAAALRFHEEQQQTLSVDDACGVLHGAHGDAHAAGAPTESDGGGASAGGDGAGPSAPAGTVLHASTGSCDPAAAARVVALLAGGPLEEGAGTAEAQRAAGAAVAGAGVGVEAGAAEAAAGAAGAAAEAGTDAAAGAAARRQMERLEVDPENASGLLALR
jgi:hypothetical protein